MSEWKAQDVLLSNSSAVLFEVLIDDSVTNGYFHALQVEYLVGIASRDPGSSVSYITLIDVYRLCRAWSVMEIVQELLYLFRLYIAPSLASGGRLDRLILVHSR